MANITITYDYENPARVNEVVDVLVALGELNYCVEKRNSKGSLSLKKVHQEVVSIDRIAEQLRESGYSEGEFEGLTKSPAAKELPPAPMPQVHRVGKDYIVSYSKYEAICHISNVEDKTYREKEEDYRIECSPLHSHEALFNIDFIGKKFGSFLDEEYPAGLPTEWIEGQAYLRLPFNLVINHMDTAEPLFLAHLDIINGLHKVFYRTYIGKKVEEYLSGKGE